MYSSRVTHAAIVQYLIAAPAPLFNPIDNIISKDRRELLNRKREVAANASYFGHQAACVGRHSDAGHLGNLCGWLTYYLRIETALWCDYQFGKSVRLRARQKTGALRDELSAHILFYRSIHDHSLLRSAD